MTKFCTGCGRELPEKAAFCTECGTPAPAEPDEPQQTVQEAPPVSTAPQYIPPQQPAEAVSPVVSTGSFFGLMFLFAIPIIGLVACIITAVSSKNQNRKNFAKAMLIWLIIGLVLSIILGIIAAAAGGAATAYFKEALGAAGYGGMGTSGELEEFMQAIKQFQ